MLFPRKSLSRSVLLLFMSCLWGVLQTVSQCLEVPCPIPCPEERAGGAAGYCKHSGKAGGKRTQ